MPKTGTTTAPDAKTEWIVLLDGLRRNGFGETLIRTITSRAEAMAKQRESEMLSSITTVQKVVEPILPLAEVERKAILDVIDACRGNRVKAAELLGVGKSTLYRKLKEYGG